MSLDYAEKYDVAGEVAGSILGQTKGYAVSTAADVVSSMWNSLPFTPEVGTEDILKAVDKDSLAFYNEHPDLVHTTSLLAGAVIPGAVSLKLLNRAREGLTSLGYTSNLVGSVLSGAKQTQLAEAVTESYRVSGAATAEYKALRNQLYLAAAGTQFIDNAVMELAVVGTLNAHPYMEDYLKDPYQNFGISVAIGGVLGAGFAIPAARKGIINSTGEIATQMFDTIKQSGFKAVPEDLPGTAQIQAHTQNVRNLEGIVQDPKYQNTIIYEAANSFLTQEKADRERALMGVAPWLEAYKGPQADEMKQTVMDLLSKPEFLGVDKLRFYDLGSSGKVIRDTPALLKIITGAESESGSFQQSPLKKLIGAITGESEQKTISNSFITEEGKAAVGFIRLSTGEVFAASGARNAALAVDIANVEKQIKLKAGDTNKIHIPYADFGEDNLLRGITSAESDARTLHELRIADNLTDAQLENIAIAPGDLARMNGITSLLGKLTPEQKARARVFLRSDMPTYSQAEKFLQTSVAPDYTDKVRHGINTYSFAKAGISSEASNMVEAWIGGAQSSKGVFRRAMDGYLRGSALPKGEAGNEKIAGEVWNAGEKFRNYMRQQADSDGYVYLYRGLQSEARGHGAIESYTMSPKVAEGFGNTKLYRVNVDNIIGTVGNSLGENEILVGAPHNQIVNNIPIATKSSKEVFIEGQGAQQHVNIDEVPRIQALDTEQQVRAMMAQRFGFEEISARLNIKTDAVRAVAAGGHLTEFPTEWRRYTDPNAIDSQYLAPRNKLFAAVGNPLKNQNAEALSSLDARQQRVANTEIIAQKTLLSNSEIGREALDIFDQPAVHLQLDDMLNKLGQINNQLIGKPTWQSADMTLRNVVGGSVITWIGKQVINRTDALKESLLKPMAEAFTPLRDKPAAIAEFNNVVNKLRGLEGWRDIKLDPEQNKYVIVQRDKKGNEFPVRDEKGNTQYINQPEVVSALESMRKPSGELLSLHNLTRDITGRGPVNDLGFYIPPLSLVNKSYAFVIDNSAKENVKLLVAGNESELEDLVATFKRSNADKPNLSVVRKGIEQEDFNLAKGYTDYESNVTYANVAFQNKGATATAITPSDTRFIEEIVQSYENMVLQGFRKYSEIYLHDITGPLDNLSAFYRRSVEGQPKKAAFKENAHDSALTVKNILLGRDQLEQSASLKQINTITEMLLNRGYNAVNNFVRANNNLQTEAYYNGLSKTLKDAGVEPIWKSFDEYLTTTRADSKNIAPTIISVGNGLLATMQLRMFEVAQAAVNIMSLPILTWASLMEKLPHTDLNPQGGGITFPLRVMYQGVRHMFSEDAPRLEAMWEKQGAISNVTRQFTDTVGALKSAVQGGDFLDKGLRIANDIQNSAVVKDFLAKPADWAEKFTRKFAMHTGFVAAKAAYPGIDDLAATMAAASFSDRAIGNYHSAQRPTMFQGTFGSAIGLYQTYFLSWAQHVYRGVEEKNFAHLAALAGTQAGIFGIASWPGFQSLSEQIVGRFNDKHYDLTTGTFRAAENKSLAEVILYGLPSSLGPAVYTRGDISPRVPGSVTEIALVNGIKEGWNAAYQIAKSTVQGIGQGTPVQSFFEGLSLQSINRPIARWSELVTGNSVTRQGNTVSPVSDVWTPTGVFARMFATRDIEEAVTRDAVHKRQFYKAIDFENRQAATKEIKEGVRNGSLDGDNLTHAADRYMRFGGTSTGWNSAVNEAMLTSEEGSRAGMLRKLEPDSPLHFMINDLY